MMRQHCEIKIKDECKQKQTKTKSQTHRGIEVTDGLLAIEERTQDQTPAQNDPLATRHVNSGTDSLKLRETYTDWSDKEKAREKKQKKEDKGRAERGSAALRVISPRNCLCPQIWPRVGMRSFDRLFVRVQKPIEQRASGW